jgi:hypothetical protein
MLESGLKREVSTLEIQSPQDVGTTGLTVSVTLFHHLQIWIWCSVFCSQLSSSGVFQLTAVSHYDCSTGSLDEPFVLLRTDEKVVFGCRCLMTESVCAQKLMDVVAYCRSEVIGKSRASC